MEEITQTTLYKVVFAQGSDTMSKPEDEEERNLFVNSMIPLRVTMLLYIDVLLLYKL